VGRAEASRLVSRAPDGNRLGRQPRVVRRAADRARDLDGDQPKPKPKPKKRTPQSTVDTTTPLQPPPSLLVGATLADPSQATLAAQAGLRIVRVNVTWPQGAAAPDPTVLASLQQLGSADTIVGLTASPLPVDDAGRTALAQYAAALAANVQTLHALVLAPPATSATAPSYVAAFEAIRSVLPDAPLGIPIDGNAAPVATLTATVGLDANVIMFRPAPAPGKSLWTLADLSRVEDAFPDAPIVIDGAPAPVATTLKTMACGSTVSAILLDRLSDATRASFLATLHMAERGTFVCPGATVEALPYEIQYPTSLAQPLAVSLNCNRDCLYLVTLDRGDGRPVVARRGQLTGGPASPLTKVVLPNAKLAAGSYRLDVRIVARVNPGPVAKYLSPPLPAG